MVSASNRSAPSLPAPAARRSSWPILPKRGACAPARARPRSTSSTASRPKSGPAFVEIAARPVINSTTELAEWDAFVAQRNWRGGAALHVDTGMNRLGVPADEAAALAPRVQTENHGITLLMSHLACAETPSHPLNSAQIRLFQQVRLLFRGVTASLANSSGIFLNDAAHFDLARPGAALYGVNPDAGSPQSDAERRRTERSHPANPQRRSRQDRRLWRQLDGDPRLAHRGRGDRLCRRAAARSSAASKKGGPASPASPASNVPLSAASRWILICIDITDLLDGVVHRGDIATIIGEGITVDDIATRAGTIGYEVLTHLGPRCHIVYRGA